MLARGDLDADLERRVNARIGSVLCRRYRLNRLIGIGGMAAVFAGEDREGRQVAIKMLHERFSADSQMNARLRREALVINRLKHRGVVPVIEDDISEDGRVFLVMPLLKGETLRARIKRTPKLTTNEALGIAIEVLDVLALAHAHGIVHCDVKPENIFLTHTGHVCVLDFGIARIFALNAPASFTKTGRASGTPAFMAPEQARGKYGDLDVRTDIWAVGATLFTVLSGRFVHEGDTAEELVAHAATRHAPLIASVAPDVPDAVQQVIDRALAFERSQRWVSACAMKGALAATLTQLAEELSEPPLPIAPEAATIAPQQPSIGAGSAETRSRERSPIGSIALSDHVEGHVLHRLARAGRRRPLLIAAIAATTAVVILLAGQRFDQPTAQTRWIELEARAAEGEARADLAKGLQLWLDASSHDARTKLEEAAQRDPSLAAAHLYFVAAAEWMDAETRSHLSDAQGLRTRLSPEQAALLSALEPLSDEPPRFELSTKRLEELTASFPSYPVGWLVRAAHAVRVHQVESAIALSSHVPGAIALWIRAQAELQRDDVVTARATLAACSQKAAAADCLEWAARLESNEGECESSALAARRLIALNPQSPGGFGLLARAQLGITGSTRATRAILQSKWARLPEPSREEAHWRDEYFLAAFDGEFQAAYAALEAWNGAVAKSADAAQRGWPVLSKLELDMELGHTESAQRTARDFADSSPGWLRSDYFDADIETTRALYLTNQISRVEFQRRRALNEKAVAERGGYYAEAGVRWFETYAQIIREPEDASLALDQRPANTQVVDAVFRDTGVDVEVGRMMLLAGDPHGALEPLQRATRSCSYMKSVQLVQAHLFYGDALAKVGKADEACRAYAYVLDRWGHTSESVSAHEARLASARLQCPTQNAVASENADFGK